MGYGDEIMATGLARAIAKPKGMRAAFGDGRRIFFSQHSEEIFRGNPHIARPGDENARDLVWIPHYKGSRMYNRSGGRGWIWNYDFRPTPGEIFFSGRELNYAAGVEPGFVLIEPTVPVHKGVAVNKQWPFDRWQAVADMLRDAGARVVQLDHGTRMTLRGVERFYSPDFRHGMAIADRARLILCHEGGLHHAAAALRKEAVVIFGGFIPPEVTGYNFHINLAAGGEACGSTTPCPHCAQALDSIKAEQVFSCAMEAIDGKRAGKAKPLRNPGGDGAGAELEARG